MDIILIRHSINKLTVKGEGSQKFFLTNNGGYFYFNPATKYRGLYFPEMKGENEWTLFKTIDHIKVEKELKEVQNNFSNVMQKYDNGSMKYFISDDTLVVEADVNGEITLVLDMREIYDFGDKGRIYEIKEEKGCILIEYKKYSNNVLEELSYSRYLAIKTDMSYENIKQWTEQHFKEDEERKSPPTTMYVYEALKFKCNRKTRLGIGFSDKKHEALVKARKAEKAEESKVNFYNVKADDEKKIAYNNAAKSVKDLFVEFEDNFGLYAGLPWFFQLWTRDEAISLKSLIDLEEYELAKKILRYRVNFVKEDGRIPNRFPLSGFDSADGTGWVFTRLHELMIALREKNKFDEYFKDKDIEEIKNLLNKAIEGHKKNFVEDDLVKNGINETWMDTNYKGDIREGFRIEIQALWLRMLKFHNYLDTLLHQEPQYNDYEHAVAEKVKKKFLSGNILLDGIGDKTIRPNIFLACYLYPELLSNKEWEKIFDNALEKLWFDWGGLSSIDKNLPLFCENYTGEDNKSYHRGDSWFFVNNLAAICLIRLNKEKYKDYINKILEASTKDLLYKGAIGRSSELSSASQQKAQASLFQLWSSATYIELIKNG